MNYFEKFFLWQHNEFFDETIREELKELNKETDAEEIKDRFETDLSYSYLDGVSALVGAGSNRINVYTIGQMAFSYGVYLKKEYGKKCISNGVVVCYGTRKNSALFARVAAKVLTGLGIVVFLEPSPVTIGFASFVVSHIDAIGGIMVTTENLDVRYNGLKFYDKNGCEIGNAIINAINGVAKQVEFYDQIDFDGLEKLIRPIDYNSDYVTAVLKTSQINEFRAGSVIKIGYTPLFGLGDKYVYSGLIHSGFSRVLLVDNEVDFEKMPRYITSIDIRDEKNYENLINQYGNNLNLIMSTSLDCEKLYVGVKTNFDIKFLSSNQMAILLLDFLLSRSTKSRLQNSIVLKTAFSSNLFDKMTQKYNIECFDCGNDFVDIVQIISKISANANILFAFDCDYSFLIGGCAKEKDAFVTTLVFAEMCNYYKIIGKSMLDRIKEIYSEFGYYEDFKEEYDISGKQSNLLNNFNSTKIETSPFMDTANIVLMSQSGKNLLMKKFELENESQVIFQVDLKNNKLNVYYSIHSENERDIQLQKQKLHLTIKAKYDL